MTKSVVVRDGIDIITPEESSLLDEPFGVEKTTCTVKGCGKKMSNSSALRMHLLKAHGEGELTSDGSGSKKPKLFACPVKGCTRNVTAARQQFFRIMYLLKRHYLNVHAEKKHTCPKCGKKFGTENAMDKHEVSCLKFFYCKCGAYYTTKNAVQVHVRKKGKGHERTVDPNEETNQNLEEKDKQNTAKQNQLITVPCMLYIPKATSASPSTQVTPKSSTDIEITKSPSPCWNQQYIRILPKNNDNPIDESIVQMTNTNINNVSSVATELNTHCYSLNYNTPQINHIPSEANMNIDKILTTTEMSPYYNSLNSVITYNTPINSLNNCINESPSASSVHKQRKVISKFEKRMKFLESKEAQEVLSDEPLLQCTFKQLQQQQDSCPGAKAGKVCRHLRLSRLPPNNEIQNNNIDGFGELCSTAKSLSNICTQTALTFTDIDKQESPIGQANIGSQTNTENFEFTTVEVLETSDFSTQCQLTPSSPQNMFMSASNLIAADSETQTEDFDAWFGDLTSSGCTDMETQTTFGVQTSLEKASIDVGLPPSCLDKSIQLDYILSGNSWGNDSNIFLTNSMNTGTQTIMNVPSLFMSNLAQSSSEFKQSSATQTTVDNVDFEIVNTTNSASINTISDKDIVFTSTEDSMEPISMSFGTQTVFDGDFDDASTQETLSFGTQTGFENSFLGYDDASTQETLSFGTQTGFENNFLSSSGTQTFNYFDKLIQEQDSSIIAKTIETQTAISFSDLLDSSFIDDYLNTDRMMATSETQTFNEPFQNDTKRLVTMETQT